MPFPEDPIEEIAIPENHPAGSPFIYVGNNSTLPKITPGDSSIDYNNGDDTGFALTLHKLGGTPYFQVIGIDNVTSGTPGVAAYNEIMSFGLPVAGFTTGDLIFGNDVGTAYDTRLLGHAVTINAGNGIIDLGDPSGFIINTYRLDGVDQGRGYHFGSRLTASSPTSGSAAESVVWTLPSMTFYAGRAYSVKGLLGASETVANSWLAAKLRKGLAGTTLVEWFRVQTGVNGPVYLVGGQEAHFVVGASNVTTALTVTLNASAGTYALFGTAGGAGSKLDFYDIGSAADYLADDINIPVLT